MQSIQLLRRLFVFRTIQSFHLDHQLYRKRLRSLHTAIPNASASPFDATRMNCSHTNFFLQGMVFHNFSNTVKYNHPRLSPCFVVFSCFEHCFRFVCLAWPFSPTRRCDHGDYCDQAGVLSLDSPSLLHASSCWLEYSLRRELRALHGDDFSIESHAHQRWHYQG